MLTLPIRHSIKPCGPILNAVNRIRAFSKAKGTAWAVLQTLAYHMDENAQCYLTYTTIIRESRINKDTVGSALKKLEELGEIRIDREHRKPNVYTLLLPELEQSDKTRRGRRTRPTAKTTPEVDHDWRRQVQDHRDNDPGLKALNELANRPREKAA